jgi:hypothetical protein
VQFGGHLASAHVSQESCLFVHRCSRPFRHANTPLANRGVVPIVLFTPSWLHRGEGREDRVADCGWLFDPGGMPGGVEHDPVYGGQGREKEVGRLPGAGRRRRGAW